MWMPVELRKEHQISWSRTAGGWDTPSVGPLGKQQAFFTTEALFQPVFSFKSCVLRDFKEKLWLLVTLPCKPLIHFL